MAHASPYKTITDPELIRKKNALRKAISEEYIKNSSNPLRNIKMEGGTLVCIIDKMSPKLLCLYYCLYIFFSLMKVFKDTCL